MPLISPSHPLVMVHFPKSGGTALRMALSEVLDHRLHADYGHDPLGPHGLEVVEALPTGCVGVYGHFHPDVYRLRNPVMATFLREPVSNLISIFYYWRRCPSHGNPVHDRFLIEKPTLEAFAQHPRMRVLMSEVYFGGVDMGRFAFIGWYEQLQTETERLCALLGTAGAAVPRENVTPPDRQRDDAEADYRLMGRLRDLLAADVAFYEAMRSDRRARAA